MTERDPEQEDEPGRSERLVDALRRAATDAASRETLRELGERARGIVEELSRNARNRAAAADEARTTASAHRDPGDRPARGPGAGGGQEQVPPELFRRILELKGGVTELSDALTAVLERLETVEEQLGEPGTSLELRVDRGLERCEQLLSGLAHRLDRSAAAAKERGETVSRECAGPVLVVASSSGVRAALCEGLESQGLRCVAAKDMPSAFRAHARVRPAVALLAIGAEQDDRSGVLADWKEETEQGNLPPAVVLIEETDDALVRARAAGHGFPFVVREYGSAAMAAALRRFVRDGGSAGPPNPPEE
jgi:CheY-like chemotaxis protein